MTAPILSWLLIVGLLAVFLLARSYFVNKNRRKHSTSRHHLVEMGDEMEEFYLPGDENKDDKDIVDEADN